MTYTPSAYASAPRARQVFLTTPSGTVVRLHSAYVSQEGAGGRSTAWGCGASSRRRLPSAAQPGQ